GSVPLPSAARIGHGLGDGCRRGTRSLVRHRQARPSPRPSLASGSRTGPFGQNGYHWGMPTETNRELAEALEAARASDQRLHSIVDSAMDAIITVDKKQRITLFNRAAERIF